MSSLELNRIIAERSLEWRDETKLSFIWDEELVIAYVNTEYKKWYTITDICPDRERDVHAWLASYFKALEEAEE